MRNDYKIRVLAHSTKAHSIKKTEMILFKWIGTILCLIGIGLTSVNIYPANIFLSLIGSFIWTMAGIYQRDMPLILVEAAAVVMYFFGVVLYIANELTKWF